MHKRFCSCYYLAKAHIYTLEDLLEMKNQKFKILEVEEVIVLKLVIQKIEELSNKNKNYL